MKNTLKKIVAAGAMLVLAGCSNDTSEPKLEQFKKSTLVMEVPQKGLLVFEDVDGDGRVDSIRRQNGAVLYVAKGYENKVSGTYIQSSVTVMDEDFRDRISQPFRGQQNTGYLMADKRFKPKSD